MKIKCFYYLKRSKKMNKKKSLFILKNLLLLLVFSSSILQSQVLPFLSYSHTNTSISNSPMPYRLCFPLNYNPAISYPIVLFLHGAGERGTDNNGPLNSSQGCQLWAKTENQNNNPCFVLVPQCASNKQWVNTPWSQDNYIQNNLPISDQLSMALDIMNNLIQKYPINQSKIYITGLSMGGFGTWDAITRFPSLFSAAIPICGAGDPTKAALIGSLPLRVFHSADDSTVPVGGSRKMVNAINNLGPNNRPTNWYTEYTNQGHQSWNMAYATSGLADWLFSTKNEGLGVSGNIIEKPEILTISNGKKINIKAGASVNMKGLVLNPSANHILEDNIISKSTVAEGSGTNVSMSRVYKMTNPTSNFIGKVVYQYNNADMGAIAHNNALMEVKNETDSWSNYPDSDGVNNSVTHTFTSPIRMKSITASASGASLKVYPLNNEMEITIFPNPVNSILNIQYDGDLQIIINDILGKEIIKTGRKSIDMSRIPKGIYIVTLADIKNSKKNSYKVIKK